MFKRNLGLSNAFIFVLAFLFSACAPAPTPTYVPTVAPTALAMSTLAPTTTPTLASTPLPTLTPTITPTPAPDTSAALALARTQIKNFNDKDFSVTATWLADKRALVVIQSKISNDAWVLLPGAKEFLRVPTAAGIDGKTPLVRFEVEPDGTVVGYTANPGETKFYWQKWQGKDQWLTVKPINPDIKTADAAGLREAMSRPGFSRGEPVVVTVAGTLKTPGGAGEYVYPDPANMIERLLNECPDARQILDQANLSPLINNLAGVREVDMGPGRNSKNRVDFRLVKSDKGYILEISRSSLTIVPGEISYGGGAMTDNRGTLYSYVQRFMAGVLLIANEEVGYLLKGVDPRVDPSAKEEILKAKIRYYEQLSQRSNIFGGNWGSVNVHELGYIKSNGLSPGRVFVDSGEMTAYLRDLNKK